MCTFKRPQVVDALDSLSDLIVPENTAIKVIIADNDSTPTAEGIVDTYSQKSNLDIEYYHAPEKNISIARNKCLEKTNSDYIAFFDDDEIAPKDWLVKLKKCLDENKVDGVFGPAIALYDENTPSWIKEVDIHSNIPKRRNNKVETGHTCNALIKWKNTSWRQTRFNLDKGQSGGEDTEFFFELKARGATFDIAEDAPVYEKVDPKRLDIAWMKKRNFRAGQSYASCVVRPTNWPAETVVSFFKISFCTLKLAIIPKEKKPFWILRREFHIGFFKSCFINKKIVIYGESQ